MPRGSTENRNDRAQPSEVATLLSVFIAPRDNRTGYQGCRVTTVIEYLVRPGKEADPLNRSFRRTFCGRCVPAQPYGDRWYFSDIANVLQQFEDRWEDPQDRLWT